MWVPPETDPEARTGEQVVYLGGDLGKSRAGKLGKEDREGKAAGKGSIDCQTSFHDGHLPLGGENLGGCVEGSSELSQRWERQLGYWSTSSPSVTGGLSWCHSFLSTSSMLCGERGFSHPGHHILSQSFWLGDWGGDLVGPGEWLLLYRWAEPTLWRS